MIKIICAVLIGICLQYLTAGALADFAASIPAGEWKKFPTPTLTTEMIRFGGHRSTDYAEQAEWDSITNRLIFVGSGHAEPAQGLLYDEATDTWKSIPTPREPQTFENRMGHAYDHSTMIRDKGEFYLVTYNNYNGEWFYRYDFETENWTTISSGLAGYNVNNISQRICYAGAMEYFPDINHFIMISGDYGNRSSYLNLNQTPWTWRDLRRPSGLGFGYYHTLMEYNPVKRVMLAVSKSGDGILDTNLTFRKINHPPFDAHPLSVYLACDPVTGTYLALTNTRFLKYDIDTDTWSDLPKKADDSAIFSDPLTQGVGFTIPDYGVIGMILGALSPAKVFLYKYDPQSTVTAPAAKSPVAGISAFPNPFSGSVKINCNVTRTSDRVTYTIHDVSGRAVRHFQGRAGAIIWDGTADDNTRLSPGIYIGRLSVDGRVQASHKLYLVK
jgi:hypothetical protein